ncbi:MAG: C4-dicarboxylate ABC transporter substrate-binding protein [Desulfobacteraceae bacterium]|nr:C4-dicarboxylate ABC transporter substrate-binding protein [Desulfobacteraceae bacterium]
MYNPARRQLLKAACLGGASILFAGLYPHKASASAMDIYKGVTYLPPAYRGLRYGIDGFIDTLKQNIFDGTEIQFFDSGSLMKADAQLPALMEGNIQFMFHATTYITRSVPIVGVTGLPEICDQLYKHGNRLAIKSPLWRLINDQLAKDNLFMLTVGAGLTESEYIWSRYKQIKELTDLKGMRCRVVGSEVSRLIEKFGGKTTRIPSSQTYLALQRGTVDAAVLAINTVIARNLQEQLRFCLKLPVTGVGVAVFFKKDYWDSMPASIKEAFWKAGKWYDTHMSRTGYQQIPREQYWPLIQKAGITITIPTDRQKADFLRQVKPIWNWWKGQVGETLGAKAIALARGM